MIEFFRALQTACAYADDNDLYTLLGGRYAYGEARQGWAYPYGVYFGVSMTPENTFTEDIDDASFQVNLYAETRAESMALGKACEALYDNATLTGITGCRDITIKRVLTTPPWKDGDIWVVSVEFETLIQSEN